MVTPFLVAAGLLAMIPYLAAAFFPERAAGWVAGLPRWMRLVAPALLCLPYLLVSLSAHSFRWGWLGLYALLPVALAAVVDLGAGLGEGAMQDWLNVLVLVLLGLAVDLRWFEPAWPAHLAVFGKVLLLDAGIYAFLWVRRLDGAGFDRGCDGAMWALDCGSLCCMRRLPWRWGWGWDFCTGMGCGLRRCSWVRRISSRFF